MVVPSDVQKAYDLALSICGTTFNNPGWSKQAAAAPKHSYPYKKGWHVPRLATKAIPAIHLENAKKLNKALRGPAFDEPKFKFMLPNVLYMVMRNSAFGKEWESGNGDTYNLEARFKAGGVAKLPMGYEHATGRTPVEDNDPDLKKLAARIRSDHRYLAEKLGTAKNIVIALYSNGSSWFYEIVAW